MATRWIKWIGLFVLVAMAVTGTVLALQPAGTDPSEATAQVGEHAVSVTNATPLTQTEIDALYYMREEEKLARDVYLALYAEWGQKTFSNIASSEAKHMAAILDLLTAYGLDDPAAGKAEGEFANAELQALYNTLVAQGSTLLVEALRVGAAIEEIDIIDLRTHLAETEQAAIQDVYTNLESASESHLRTFVGQIERQADQDYTPQYLSVEDYEEIMGGASTGQGQNQDRGRRGR